MIIRLCQLSWCQPGLCDAICSDTVTGAFPCLGKRDQIKVKETDLHPIALYHLQMIIYQLSVLPHFSGPRHIATVCAQSLRQDLPIGRQGRVAVPSSGRTGWHYLRGWQHPSCWPCCGVQIFVIPVMRCQSCLVWNGPEQLYHPVLYPPWCLWKSHRKDLGCISIS